MRTYHAYINKDTTNNELYRVMKIHIKKRPMQKGRIILHYSNIRSIELRMRDNRKRIELFFQDGVPVATMNKISTKVILTRETTDAFSVFTGWSDETESGKGFENAVRNAMKVDDIRQHVTSESKECVEEHMRDMLWGPYHENTTRQVHDLLQRISQANSDMSVKKLARAIMGIPCANSGCGHREGVEKKFRVCASCRQAHYCSRDCQTDHWKRIHKRMCGH